MTTTTARVATAAPISGGPPSTDAAAEMASSRSTAALSVGSIVAKPRISRWHRLVRLAATAYLVIPLSVRAGPVVLQNVTYRIQTFGYEPASGGYAYSQESDLVSPSPRPNIAPLPLTRFIRADSDPGTTVSGSYYGTAITIQGNETLAQVSGTIQLNAYEKLGFFPQRAFLGIGVEANTYYQVMVLNTHFVPADVKGIPIIGTTAGTTRCSGNVKEAIAQVIVEDIVYAAAQCPPAIIDTSFSTKVTSTFPIGVPVNVEVLAYGFVALQVGDRATDNGLFYASADPSFEIDPSFAYADDFELVYSPGLATPADETGIPEPGSLLLLAVGAPLAMVSRRRANRPGEAPSTWRAKLVGRRWSRPSPGVRAPGYHTGGMKGVTEVLTCSRYKVKSFTADSERNDMRACDVSIGTHLAGRSIERNDSTAPANHVKFDPNGGRFVTRAGGVAGMRDVTNLARPIQRVFPFYQSRG